MEELSRLDVCADAAEEQQRKLGQVQTAAFIELFVMSTDQLEGLAVAV